MTYETIYRAALAAVREMGDDFRNISWFYGNARKIPPYGVNGHIEGAKPGS